MSSRQRRRLPFATHGGRLLTGAEAGEADQRAVDRGDSWRDLMARAGDGLARSGVRLLQEHTGGVYGRRVVVVAGKGDNGGDGWVAARHLRERGADVTVIAVHGLDVEMSDHSAAARARWIESGGRAVGWDGGHGTLRVPSGGGSLCELLVDCVLGTGATGAPRDEAAPAVELLRAAGRRTAVMACDVPSGVDADTGEVADPELVVAADVTATFGLAKRGLVLDPGARHAGRVEVVDLGERWQSHRAGDAAAPWFALGRWTAIPAPLRADDDKRSRGRVAVVAGSARYGGAPALTATAALRTGAGLVTVATSAPSGPVLSTDPGLMVRSVAAADDGVGGPAAADVATVLEVVADADVAVLGPGLGHEDDTRTVLDAVLGSDPPDEGRRVLVLDADALNVYRHEAAALAATDHLLVLTPHERELARLLDEDVELSAGGRAQQALRLAEVTGAVVVAKGPSTVVVHPEGLRRFPELEPDDPRDPEQVRVGVVTSGGPALGTGGSGDVLAGMLGAAVARHRPSRVEELAHPVDAVAQLHGHVGQWAGARAAGRATATQLLEAIRPVLASLAAERRDDRSGW